MFDSFFASVPFLAGFLGTRATSMLDILFLAQFVVVPTMLFGIMKAKQHRYGQHKTVMLALVAVLLVVVTAFEVHIQTHGWKQYAEASPYYSEPVYSSGVGIMLLVHLLFAVSTAILWVFVVVGALRRFEKPPQPGAHSKTHVRWAKIAAADMFLTAVTGCLFYYLAFWA